MTASAVVAWFFAGLIAAATRHGVVTLLTRRGGE